jgi:hypothetical protein
VPVIRDDAEENWYSPPSGERAEASGVENEAAVKKERLFCQSGGAGKDAAQGHEGRGLCDGAADSSKEYGPSKGDTRALQRLKNAVTRLKTAMPNRPTTSHRVVEENGPERKAFPGSKSSLSSLKNCREDDVWPPEDVAMSPRGLYARRVGREQAKNSEHTLMRQRAIPSISMARTGNAYDAQSTGIQRVVSLEQLKQMQPVKIAVQPLR